MTNTEMINAVLMFVTLVAVVGFALCAYCVIDRLLANDYENTVIFGIASALCVWALFLVIPLISWR